jgi:lysozyme family protein
MKFETAIERILSHEGGYANDSRDPGGETQWGIAARSYPDLNIKTLTRDDAKEIYQRDFWLPVVSLVGDSALQFQLLDAAVNHGQGNAVRFLQRAIDVADDGYFGPISRAALETFDPHDAHLLFMAERFEFWCRLASFTAFGRGWTRRGADNLRYLAHDNEWRVKVVIEEPVFVPLTLTDRDIDDLIQKHVWHEIDRPRIYDLVRAALLVAQEKRV